MELEKEWSNINEKDSQQAAYIQQMKEMQQYEEHMKKCTEFVKVIKELREKYPNDMQYGRIVDKILKANNL